ncbi:hypothetical protein [Nostoc sp.]
MAVPLPVYFIYLKYAVSACVQVLASLRLDKNLITQLFREKIMQESGI